MVSERGSIDSWSKMRLCLSVSAVLLLAVSFCVVQADQIKVIATPVVYTNGNGGGADELEVPKGSEASRLFDAGGPVLAAWWVPYDNIGDLPAIAQIHTKPETNFVHLKVKGLRQQRSARVRIMIYAQVEDQIDVRRLIA